jgi:hypothetical protein
MQRPEQNPASLGGPRAGTRIPINVLFGLPDDGQALVQVSSDGKELSFTLPGTASIVPFVSPERFILNIMYLHPGQRIPVRLGAGALLNHVGDPDVCSGALALIEQITSKIPRPCFNPPRSSIKSSEWDTRIDCAEDRSYRCVHA